MTVLKDPFTLPFSSDEYGLYIFDAMMNVVAWFNAPGGRIEGRGWGRFQYMEDGQQLYNVCDKTIKKIVGDETDSRKAVKFLNANWTAEWHNT